MNRIRRGAHSKAFKALKGLGYSDAAAERAIADASDVAKLEQYAEVE